jgi:hypothetical protein
MVGSPTRTNWLPHRIDRAQLGAARNKTRLARAVRLIKFLIFRFIPFAFLTRMLHESLAATLDMAVLPGVLGCRLLRRTFQVRFGTNPAVLRDRYPVARPSSWSRDINS